MGTDSDLQQATPRLGVSRRAGRSSVSSPAADGYRRASRPKESSPPDGCRSGCARRCQFLSLLLLLPAGLEHFQRDRAAIDANRWLVVHLITVPQLR